MHNTGHVECLIELIREKLKPGTITGWFHLLDILEEIKLELEGKNPDQRRKKDHLTLNGETAAKADEVEKRLGAVMIKDADLVLLAAYSVRTVKGVQSARNFAAEIVAALESVTNPVHGMVYAVFQNFRVRAFEAADLHDFGELDPSRKVPLFFSYGGAITPERPWRQTIAEFLEQVVNRLAYRDPSDY